MIGSAAVRIAVEAGVRQGWDRFIGEDGLFVGMTGFGASAPYERLYAEFDITAEAVAEAARRRLAPPLTSSSQPAKRPALASGEPAP